MFQSQFAGPSSCRKSLKAIEADIHHANSLAAAVQRAYGGACLQMSLSLSPFATVYLFLMQWLDCTCAYPLPSYLGLLHVLVYKVYVDGKTKVTSYERQATLREFYGVIYPSLQQLESNMTDMDDTKEWNRCRDIFSKKVNQEWNKLSDKELERENECGICMESCTKMVLPDCNHAMCINCYHDWYRDCWHFIYLSALS
uniref:RING finger protein 141 n=1 Tax=Anthurium amnicola TaxID=1678845 RepID=A0A1D1Z7E6_9ARAE